MKIIAGALAMFCVYIMLVTAWVAWVAYDVVVNAVTELIVLTVRFAEGTAVLLLAAGTVAIGVFAFVVIERRRDASRRQVDGSMPLQRHRFADGTEVIIDLAQVATGGYAINKRTGFYAELPSRMPEHDLLPFQQAVQGRRAVQAMAPGDNAIIQANFPVKASNMTAAAMRLFGKSPKRSAPTVMDAFEPEPEPVALFESPAAALVAGNQQEWVVGQSPATGEVAVFNPMIQAHAGIVGNTGTGKTTSVGFMLTAQAIRHGYHVVILDPDGGEDWSVFNQHAEHFESDRSTFPDQVRTIYAEFERRDNGERGRPILVVLEEYGDLISQLRMADRKAATAVDDMLDTILRRGRKRSVHLMFVDQYPEHWHPQVIGGTKFQAVFQLGPNQGAKMQQYHAHELADRGEFLFRGERYRSWDASAQVPALLAGAPRLNGYRVMGGSAVHEPVHQAVRPEVAPPPAPPANATNDGGNTPAKWREFTDRWFEQNPIYITEPYGGISALARAMAAADGGGDYTNYKSVAKEYFDAFRGEVNAWMRNTTKE